MGPVCGENALIIQRGSERISAAGPTLYKIVEKRGAARLVEESCEYVVRLAAGTDPDLIPESDRFELSEGEQASYAEALGGNKIGGTPGFLQGRRVPGGLWVRRV